MDFLPSLPLPFFSPLCLLCLPFSCWCSLLLSFLSFNEWFYAFWWVGTLNVHMVFSSVLFSGVFFLSFLPPAGCCCGLLMVGLKCPLTLLLRNSQILFQFIETVMDWRVLDTKLISFTFCVCFTFQHQLWVVYVLCKIGVRNSGLLLILRKRPPVLRVLLLHHITWSCKISGWKTANKHLDCRLKFSMGHQPETGDTKKGTCFFPRIKFWLYAMSMILLLLHRVQCRILKVPRLIQLYCSIIDTP